MRFVWVVVEQPGLSFPIPPSVDDVLDLNKVGSGWVRRLRGRPVVEACTAVKAAALSHLLGQPGCTEVLYLDPDIYVYGALTPVWLALEHSSIVLTPHMLSPSRTSEGIRDNEISAMKHGIFNLGFIAVASGPIGKEFSAWWDSRLRDFCLDAPGDGLFTDQRWIDHVPVFFEGVHILRHEGCNVASWNLGERDITERDGKIWVGRVPLVFWHFSSVDNEAHRTMIDKYARGDLPGRISDQYRTALAGYRADYGWYGPWSLAGSRGPLWAMRVWQRRLALVPLRLMSSRPVRGFVQALVPKSVRQRIRRRLLAASDPSNV